MQPGIMRIAAPVLAALWLAGMLAWGVWGLGDIALFISFVNLGVSYLSRARAERAAALFFAKDEPDAASTDEAADDLKLLAAVLAQVERQTFTVAQAAGACKPRLTEGRGALARHRPAEPPDGISRLRPQLDLRVLDPFIFWNMQFSFAIEAWRRQFGPAIGRLAGGAGRNRGAIVAGGLRLRKSWRCLSGIRRSRARSSTRGLSPIRCCRAAHAVRNDLHA